MKFRFRGGQKCGDRSGNGSEGDVKKNVEPDEVATQVMEVKVGELRILTTKLLDYFLRARGAAV